jgi:2-polyprenyl-6-methoxyphenol hydroxylase-like FAD-dependent oxidoreductase
MSTPPEKPHVLIVGAGIGGLLLGNLLEKSNVPYTIFERAAAVKPLGTHMQCQSTIMREQRPSEMNTVVNCILECQSLILAFFFLVSFLVGSCISVGPNLLAVFEQLGIYEHFLAISIPMNEISYFKPNMTAYKAADYRPVEGM